MQGKCLWCDSEQNLTERLVKGQGCRTCGAPLKQALAELLAEAVGMTVAMSEDYGCNPVALATMPSFADIVRAGPQG